jgi:ATP-binding cassette subfamily C protein LapB
MDTRTEQQFIQRLRQADLKSTLLIITHRTSLLPLVGRVMILERGQVSAIGSTDQFLQAQAQAKAQAASGATS